MILNFEDISQVERTPEAFRRRMADNLYYTRGQAIYTASPFDLYMALSITVRDYMMYYWQKNVTAYWEQNPKLV